MVTLDFALEIVEALATLAFALSGLLAAAKKRLDIVGMCVVAGLTAFGGGTIRDSLLDRRPFYWVTNAYWLWVLMGMCVAALLFMRSKHLQLTERAIEIPDALGLGLFTVSGTQIAVWNGMPAVVAVLMGVVTAVFGGVLRDIVCNDVPSTFSDHRPYAVCAFVGAWAMLGLQGLGMDVQWSLVMAALLIVGLRLWAVHVNYQLPSWRQDDGT